MLPEYLARARFRNEWQQVIQAGWIELGEAPSRLRGIVASPFRRDDLETRFRRWPTLQQSYLCAQSLKLLLVGDLLIFLLLVEIEFLGELRQKSAAAAYSWSSSRHPP